MKDRAEVLLRKLNALHTLTPAEQEAVALILEHPRVVERNVDIAGDGSEPRHSTVILSGIACRYKSLPDGRRQILAFQFPGDVTDIYSYVLKKLDHGIGTITRCEIANIPHAAIRQVCERYPNVAYALWRDSLVDTSILSMAVVNNGRRNADERIAHILCEQFIRMSAVGLAEQGRPSRFYVSQKDIADAAGLSLVHVNKTLKKLKDRGLIGRNPQQLEILDWEGLKEVAGFDPSYLHFKQWHG